MTTLFHLQTAVLNKHLNELMEGLTAKVFRTYNASITLQNQLKELTDPDASIPEKVRANALKRINSFLRSGRRSKTEPFGKLDFIDTSV